MSTTAIIAAGIFANESGQRLLQILLKLGERGFKGLHDKCSSNITGAYFQQGLRRVHLWSDEVLLEDISFVKAECPDLEETYEACFLQYVNDRFGGTNRQKVSIPLVLEFVRRFLESLGQHETLITADYFVSRDAMLKRIACMDACRQALYTLATSDRVQVVLASEVGSVVPSRPHARALSETTPSELASHVEVHPADSISQVGLPAVRSQPPPSSPRRSVAPSERLPEVPPPDSPPPPPPVSLEDTLPEAPPASPTLPAVEFPNPPSPPKSVVSIHLPSRMASKASSAFHVPPSVASVAKSTISRHDFEERPLEDDVPVAQPRPTRQVASSRDSSVSIGMRTARSPKH